MSILMRYSQPSNAGTYGRAFIGVADAVVTIAAQTTETTTVARWRIRCWASPSDTQFAPTLTNTGDITPVAVATGTDATPTFSFTPPDPGPYIFSVETWSDAAGTAGYAYDVRELHVAWPQLGDCEEASVIGPTLKDLIDDQIAANKGPHNNFGGLGIGWSHRLRAVWSALNTAISGLATASTNASTALSNAATAQSRADAAYTLAGTANTAAGNAASAAAAVQDDFDAVATSESLDFSATIACTQTGIMTYDGTDESIVFARGTPPFVPGAFITVVIPAGTVTGANTVTCESAFAQPADWPAIDSAHDYVLSFLAETTTSIRVSAVSETRPTVDTTPPTITSVTVADANPNRLVVATNEATTWTDATGFSLTGYTLGAVTGSGTTHYVAVSPQVPAGSSPGTLVWDATNTVQNAALLALAAGSRSVTNNVVAPTIQSASIVGDVLTLNMSEPCTCGGAAGLTLSGTSETVSSLTSGSGTATLVFALSGSVTSGTVTLAASGSNQITDAGGTVLAPVSGISVSLAAAPTISSATIDGDELTLVFSEAVTHSSTMNWSASVAGASSTVTYASGSLTTTLVYTTSVAAENGDTVTITATAPTGHASTANGVALAAFSGQSVTNETAGATTLFSDDFSTAKTQSELVADGWDFSWDPAPAATVTGGNLVRSDAGGPCPLPVFANFPADNYRLTVTLDRAQIVAGHRGFILQQYNYNGVIVCFFYHTDGFLRQGPLSGGDGYDTLIAGTYPASWSNAGLHTIAIEKTGTTYTVYVDNTALTPFTVETNSTQANAGVGFFGIGGTYASILVESI